MTDTRFFERDDFLGVNRYFHGEDDGSFRIESVSDVEPLIEVNKFLVNTEEYNPKSENRRVAQIPAQIFAELMRKGIRPGTKEFDAWLNDRDQRVFRTNEEYV